MCVCACVYVCVRPSVHVRANILPGSLSVNGQNVHVHSLHGSNLPESQGTPM